MKILIVEDDPDILDFIRIGFESEGYGVDVALDGERGSFLARTTDYDAIVLDYSLPLRNGIGVCKHVRTSGKHTPIIFLSVIADTRRKIEALTAGADDYVTKPFHFEELIARVRALLRRPKKIQDTVIRVGELVLDTEKKVLTRSGKPVYLTRKEYSLCEYLMRNPETPVSRSMIMEHVWSSDSDPFSNTIESHMSNLRKKLNAGFERDAIRNIPGRGYLIDA
jgi:DNA-binding response OmpR family regulator